MNYPVHAVPPLEHWAHSSGRFTLAGDAAHAMAFYLSMGVSLAVEDAVSLTAALDLVCPTSATDATSRDGVDNEKLKVSLNSYETVRMRRAQAVQQASLYAGDMLHIPGNREREILYESLKGADEDTPIPPAGHTNDRGAPPSSNHIYYGLMDRQTRDWCYGYDAVADVAQHVSNVL